MFREELTKFGLDAAQIDALEKFYRRQNASTRLS